MSISGEECWPDLEFYIKIDKKTRVYAINLNKLIFPSLRNIYYYRALYTVQQKINKNSPFQNNPIYHTSGCYSNLSVIEICKLFGSVKNNKTHYHCLLSFPDFNEYLTANNIDPYCFSFREE